MRNGILVLKFFLYLSKDEQRRRFLERIEDSRKNWKFSEADLHECRSLLGTNCNLTDAQLERLRLELYALSEVAIGAFCAQASEPMGNDSNARTVPSMLSQVPENERVEVEKRAAILEYELGRKRSEAERQAFGEWAHSEKPAGPSSKQRRNSPMRGVRGAGTSVFGRRKPDLGKGSPSDSSRGAIGLIPNSCRHISGSTVTPPLRHNLQFNYWLWLAVAILFVFGLLSSRRQPAQLLPLHGGPAYRQIEPSSCRW